jgi:hypothetical protein
MAGASVLPTSPVPYGAKAPAERQGACPGGFCDGVVRSTSDKNALVRRLCPVRAELAVPAAVCLVAILKESESVNVYVDGQVVTARYKGSVVSNHTLINATGQASASVSQPAAVSQASSSSQGAAGSIPPPPAPRDIVLELLHIMASERVGSDVHRERPDALLMEAFGLLRGTPLDSLRTVLSWLLCGTCKTDARNTLRYRYAGMKCSPKNLASLWPIYRNWTGKVGDLTGKDGQHIAWALPPMDQQQEKGESDVDVVSFRGLVMVCQTNFAYSQLYDGAKAAAQSSNMTAGTPTDNLTVTGDPMTDTTTESTETPAGTTTATAPISVAQTTHVLKRRRETTGDPSTASKKSRKDEEIEQVRVLQDDNGTLQEQVRVLQDDNGTLQEQVRVLQDKNDTYVALLRDLQNETLSRTEKKRVMARLAVLTLPPI